ncbi:unnamed protein product [Cylicocyclus nassatus]|uniref:Ig-like domain-containing protein n=1 Tax=Cylicocyclus nassatus TaxID=53992 RepID=A0AA36HCR8_CYLNA|nr:unnamed protein product [Cylicocyclus nassatus]
MQIEGWNATAQAYDASYNNPVAIKCSEQIASDELSSMSKMWRKDGEEHFSTDNIVFIENNKSILFTSLTRDDSGIYSCCVKSPPETSYKCIEHLLTVVGGSVDLTTMLLHKTNDGEARNATTWSVLIADDHILNAIEGDTYYIKLFEENVTDVSCTMDGSMVAEVETTHIPAEYGDILIRSFNGSINTGNYTCNASYMQDNSTKELQVYFAAIESPLPNVYQEELDQDVVSGFTGAKFTNSFLFCVYLIVMYRM